MLEALEQAHGGRGDEELFCMKDDEFAEAMVQQVVKAYKSYADRSEWGSNAAIESRLREFMVCAVKGSTVPIEAVEGLPKLAVTFGPRSTARHFDGTASHMIEVAGLQGLPVDVPLEKQDVSRPFAQPCRKQKR